MRAAGASLLVVLMLAGCGGGSGKPVGAEDARRCLSEDGGRWQVQGPLKREAGDVDAPDRTLIVSGRGTLVYLGWYDDEARAERSAVDQREQAKQFDGSVERHGGMTMIWVRGRDGDAAARIKQCALA